MATQRATNQWIDVNGGTRLTTITTSAGEAAVVAALVAKSNADVLASWEGPLTINGAPVVAAATYQSTRDAATLTFKLVTSDLVKILLPAPQAGIFFADGETVNPAAIAAIIAAVIANVVDESGNAVASFVGGTRNAQPTP